MESTMVIKVKYGEMLRRFSVRVYENDKLDLDISGLRAKVLDLFNFSSDTDVTLTYIDEDGDIVTLVNDDDLQDVMRQDLKFLRIDVHPRNEKNDQSHDRSSDGSFTPLMSARGQDSFQNIRTGIFDVLKSLPEPLPGFCAHFLLDIASKAAASPVVAELGRSFIRLGNTHLNGDSQSPSVPETSTQNVATESSRAPLGADSKASKDDCFHQEARSNSKCTGYKDCKIANCGSVAKNVEPASVDLNALPRDIIASGFAVGKSAIAAPCSSFFDGKTVERVHSLFHSNHNNPIYSPAAYLDENFINDLPFSGVPEATGPSMLGTVGIDPVKSSSGYDETVGNVFPVGRATRNSSDYIESMGGMFPVGRATRNSDCIESTGSMFHRGVICDGCGARPITGPRYKSQVKDNYDLCFICFTEMGNETDYMRIDRPISFPHPRMKALNRHRHSFGGPRIFNTLKTLGKQTGLDCHFVADVNILDGTVMAPSTPFTKIWRLCNSGSLKWPCGTQLVMTDGVKISDSVSVEVKVPADGLPVGQEIEIAVDFITPPISGQFTSYWRMSSPSGQTFGQRVWVFIRVDTALGRPDSNNSQALDLNFPPNVIADCGGLNGHGGGEKYSSTPAILPDGFFFRRDSCPFVEQPYPNLTESEVDLQALQNQTSLATEYHATSSKEDNLVPSYPLVDCPGVLPSSSEAPSVSYPLVDFSKPIPAANPPPIIPPPSPKVEKDTASANNTVEETLLKTLVDMGFDQVDINKEVLMRTGYDLQKALDELCVVADWDPLLEELQEMGFGDTEMNRLVLLKNNGSMKRAVMELIYGEKVCLVEEEEEEEGRVTFTILD